MKVDYISPLQDYKVDLEKLIDDYKKVESKLEDRVRPGTKVLVQKAFTLVSNNTNSEDIKNLQYTLNIVTHLRKVFIFNTVTYRLIMPDTCYSWHTDFGQLSLHIPLITNDGCRFVYEDRAFYMPADGTVFLVNNEKAHSFMNGGKKPRIHILFENYHTRPDRL